MPFNITIDHATTAHNSDQSSLSSDEEDSTGTGVQVSPRSAADSHEEYSDPVEEPDGSWIFPDEIGPSDSASRPRTSNQQRPIVEAPQPENARRSSYRRHITHERARPPPRAHRAPPSEPAESVDSHEDWQGYARGPPHQYHGRPYTHYAPNYPPHPPHPPPNHPHAYQQYPAQSVVATGQQQMVPYGFSPYQQPAPMPTQSYFPPNHHGGMSHEMMAHPPGAGYFPYAPQSFPMPIPPPPAVYQVYTPPPAPAPAVATPPAKTPPPPPAPPDTSKEDEKYARLEKLFLDQKAEREAKEAALEKAAKDAVAQAEADKKKAAEIAAASASAAAAAREDVEKEYKAAADAAAAAAEAAAAAKAAKPPPPPKEPDKPIKFKDAIGRRFSFPFDLCKDWRGMEYLIKEAFLHVDVYGVHVANGEYDLVGPHDEIIMKHVWEVVIQPGWEISMHMWPIPEPPPVEEGLVDGLADIVIVDEEKKSKKKKEKVSPFTIWTAGKPRKKGGKAKK